MRTTEHSSRRQAGFWIGVGVLTMLCAAAPPLHAETVQATIPSTTAHYFSSRPMIAGTVVTINDHRMVVDTEQGERITLVVDSRTMAPRDVAPGMRVRTEFAALENCRFHADRVIPVRKGMSGQRVQAYALPRETQEQLASYGSPIRLAANEGRPAGNPSHGTNPSAMPGTVEHLYSTRPFISGTVLSVNDHRVLVKTDQGRKVAMVMDSRTMVPRELAPGSRMRAEFTQMQDGRYYAQRIHLISPGTEHRVQAYANTMDNDVESAGIIGDCESVAPTPGNSATAVVAAYQPDRHGNRSESRVASSEQNGTVDPNGTSDQYGSSSQNGTSDQNRATGRNGTSAQGDDRTSGYDETGGVTTLPQTASQRPLYLLLGLLALGAAGVSTFARSRTG
jgi:hypothetical protein